MVSLFNISSFLPCHRWSVFILMYLFEFVSKWCLLLGIPRRIVPVLPLLLTALDKSNPSKLGSLTDVGQHFLIPAKVVTPHYFLGSLGIFGGSFNLNSFVLCLLEIHWRYLHSTLLLLLSTPVIHLSFQSILGKEQVLKKELITLFLCFGFLANS